MSQRSILIDALSSAFWGEKKEKEMARELFSQLGPALLAVPCRIFAAVRCN
jgi:hypothetical protein